jgi:hypothetical protein
VAIRIRKPQGERFDDGSRVRHFAVLSNRWELPAAALIAWHREKAGTIELVHDVIKIELGGGVLHLEETAARGLAPDPLAEFRPRRGGAGSGGALDGSEVGHRTFVPYGSIVFIARFGAPHCTELDLAHSR